ncbi:peptidoglycan editing factor PgeF [Psychromonas sp. B3M02]|uniref:peptidoglycan editing factor PgeF n=1 Tax=Psychromonas sp. B3M02 TaxID=2267226 RepID=UPI000DE9D64C|nr:peptidoglycan editing factor PgeF [Psychromonas sp. B3M02]RBW43403.1 peptidoglycan editing factor PgeF [Psychromonas sp. B3M02]
MQLIKPNWDAPARVHAYSTTRLGGVSEQQYAGLNLGLHVQDDPNSVATNRQLLSKQAQGAGDFCWLNQTHSNRLIKVSASTKQGIDADASWTTSTERTCVVMTADCLPVLITDQQGSFVAAIHAGWRGLYDGIIENSITTIRKELEIPSQQLLVWLGPCIGPEAFEVGDEVRRLFVEHEPSATHAFIAGSPGKWFADLHALARLRLTGFPGVNISATPLCTYNDPHLFYSYRRDGQTGRLATFIYLN